VIYITFFLIAFREICVIKIHDIMKNLFTILLLAIGAVGCFDKKSATEKDRDNSDPLAEARADIAASNAIYFTSYSKNDSSIFIERYAEDACIMAPNSPAMCGRMAAAKFFRDSYRYYGMRNGKFMTTAIYGDGKEYVTEEGLWQSFDEAGNLFDDGKFLVLWRRTGNGWKMYRDSFSSNRQN
jgi:ketosteroid isomerase-like protein